MTDGVHKYGARIFMQLSGGAGRTIHSSVEAMERKGITKDQAFFAPMDEVANFWDPAISHRALTIEEIHEFIFAFARLSVIAKDCGFDGIENCTNKREDEYGGSLAGRYKFCCDIIKAIKKECGEDFPVSVRYSVCSKMKGFREGALPEEDFSEFGRGEAESLEGAALLEKLDAICWMRITGHMTHGSGRILRYICLKPAISKKSAILKAVLIFPLSAQEKWIVRKWSIMFKMDYAMP